MKYNKRQHNYSLRSLDAQQIARPCGGRYMYTKNLILIVFLYVAFSALSIGQGTDDFAEWQKRATEISERLKLDILNEEREALTAELFNSYPIKGEYLDPEEQKEICGNEPCGILFLKRENEAVEEQ